MLRAGKIGSFLYIRDPEVANKIQHIAVEETRLGIPVIFADDVVHGFFTTFPTPAAEACSWEPELSRRTAECSARESRANGIQWNFMPMVDIARDARWGRNVEGAGEDPYLGSLFASARVKGYQGDDISKPDRMAACAKHFIGYSGCEGGREYNSVEMSEQTLYNVYLPPFQATVDAGVATFMTAFHDLNGIPCTGNKRIMTKLLRNEMNFDGVLVSDARAVGILKDHGFTNDDKESAYKNAELVIIATPTNYDDVNHFFDTS
ncbi:MAG: glycoside hydrolase family 3 N-terminal domain-containing protein, partial [Acutalibacteraceae bacterium]|nr:glycoside hydrolase family 3 N-terminal domain-containing protein [Acutalibacteraceae bacterium]